MGKLEVSAERTIEAPAATVYGYLADMRSHHPKFLPPAFSQFRVDSGGVGAGTVISFKLTAGGRSRDYQMTLSEPEPGRVLKETDANSSLVTTFTVVPQPGGCAVEISTTWDGAGGVGGIFERIFAPRVMRALYSDELERLARYAQEPAEAS